MLILALETASEIGGAALLDGPRLLAEHLVAEPPHRAASLMLSVDRLLETCGRRLEEVEVLALSVGPGSFTGLRLGLGTALGLCFGTGRRIVPVPTLAALSLHAGDRPRIAPLLDARKGQVYAGLYAPGGEPLAEEGVFAPLDFLRGLPGEGPVTLLGPGAELYRNEIESVLGPRAQPLPAPLGWPRAASVGLLGQRLLERGEARAPEKVELHYLRPPDAQPPAPAPAPAPAAPASPEGPVDTPGRNP